MKQVLVLFATVLILIPEVYAQDDKLIDGIKFRVGNYTTIDKFELGKNIKRSHNGKTIKFTQRYITSNVK